MKKKKGSILIELIASIFILSLFSVFVTSTCLKCKKEYVKRIEEEKVNRVVNMIIKEFKYNLTKQECDSLFDKNNEFGMKYEDSLEDELTYKNIVDIESGTNIQIEKERDEKSTTYYKVVVNISEDDFDINKDYEFCKSWWMDEI